MLTQGSCRGAPRCRASGRKKHASFMFRLSFRAGDETTLGITRAFFARAAAADHWFSSVGSRRGRAYPVAPRRPWCAATVHHSVTQAIHLIMITRKLAGWRSMRPGLFALALLCTLGAPRLLADDPKPDPNGGATGVAADVPGFIVNAPAELSDEDKKDK